MCPSDDDFLFAHDDYDEEDDLNESQVEKSWHVLIVDDDKEIHSVTKLALSDLIVFEGDLAFSHAYSGKEAKQFMAEHDDVAIILLDVVMETEDAGLQVAKYIREELKLSDVRIILRTGQPGYAPEESVVKEFDINDYKTKTELTRSKLVTTIISSLRSYQQIRAINENTLGLNQILDSSAELLKQHSFETFAEKSIAHIAKLLKIEAQGLLSISPLDSPRSVNELIIDGGTDAYKETIGARLIDCDNGRAIHQISQCLEKQHDIFTEHETILYIKATHVQAAIYIESGREDYSDNEKQLLTVLLANTTIGLDNIDLLNQVSEAAYTDWLTKLPNRTEFTRQLDLYAKNQRLGDIIALVDIDHFSDFNDGLGQETGNQLIVSVAKGIQEVLDENCTLARIGADVFGIIGHELLITPEKLGEVFEHPFKVGDHAIPVSACFGLCKKDEITNSGVGILKQSNIALNRAKKSPVHNCEYYSPEMEEQTAWRLGMIRQLKKDFSQQRLELWYQPQWSLASGKMIGMEALLRWPTQNGQYIPPSTFIPLAEYSGLIVDIGNWVIEEACRQLRQIDNIIDNNLRISVNLSAQQLKNVHFVEHLIATIDKFGVSPERFELEITESALMADAEMLIETLTKLKNAGIRLAIDDFGTGFSSFSYLQRLPLDRINVDRRFVQDLSATNGTAIAETIIGLGKRLGLSTTVEGIETKEQEEYLKSLGCDDVQGFLYAKPLPAEELQSVIIKSLQN